MSTRTRVRFRRALVGLAGVATATATATTLAGLAAPSASASTIGDRVVAVAASKAGDPYVYGGSGPTAFDCSGLVQYVFRSAGVSLPRTAQEQYGATTHVPQSQKQPGDIIFFYDASGHVYHDGIYAGGNTIWAAPHPGAVVRQEAIWTSAYWVGRAAGGSAPVAASAPVTAAPAAYVATSSPLLRMGATGSAVAVVQRDLQITADGIFGPQTLGAIIAFQRAHGLAVDGVVGPQTWGVLRTIAA